MLSKNDGKTFFVVRINRLKNQQLYAIDWINGNVKSLFNENALNRTSFISRSRSFHDQFERIKAKQLNFHNQAVYKFDKSHQEYIREQEGDTSIFNI